MSKQDGQTFAANKASALVAEAQGWDTSEVTKAYPGDIPIIDVGAWLNGDGEPPSSLINELREACEHVGFYSLVGHGIDTDLRRRIFDSAKAFHALDLTQKTALAMDQPGNPSGIGYLPVKHRKLPKRSVGNENEAFIIKRDLDLDLEQNLWPEASLLPSFRRDVECYAEQMERLAKALLPLYAAALEMPLGFFDEAFTHPLYRLRLSHYPALKTEKGSGAYGIAPHVDTTFITILAQNEPGLAVFSERREQWIQVPVIDNAFVVNTGELLKQWTNDRFVSVKHFANNADAHASRYSVPFFFNANSDYPMACVPSCQSPENPPRYPTISYAQSQGVVQGE